jgi:hypothetical protein
MLDAGFAAGELATNVREVSAEQRAELVRRAGLLRAASTAPTNSDETTPASRERARRRLASARTEAADIGKKRA